MDKPSSMSLQEERDWLFVRTKDLEQRVMNLEHALEMKALAYARVQGAVRAAHGALREAFEGEE